MNLFWLGVLSLLNRKLTSGLCVVSIALSTFLLLSIERLKKGAENSFSGVITGADFVVGAPGSQLNILLYSVFHMGESIKNIKFTTFENVRNDPRIEWSIPISLGDSHKGYRVVATDDFFFKHYQYREAQSLEFSEGQAWNNQSPIEVVLGADVAKQLGYKMGDKITLTHGLESVSESDEHKDNPFKIVGILKKTGTPVDRGLYITLEAMELIHVGWDTGVSPSFFGAASAPTLNLPPRKTPKSITSFICRLKDRRLVLHMNRSFQNDFGEPLMGAIPGITLTKLWQTLDIFEQVLKIMAFLVLMTGFIGVAIALLTSLNERRREMAILRSLGASPRTVLSMLVLESQTLSLLGLSLGFVVTFLVLRLAMPMIENEFGLSISVQLASSNEWKIALTVFAMGFITSLWPAIRAYKNSLADGLSIKQ
jgi:putative ABC transport system permease protein